MLFHCIEDKKKVERDFEKYSKLVHDDSSVSVPLKKEILKKL